MRHGSLDPRRPPPAPGRSRGTSNLPNPGSFDSLHRQCKDVFPVQMEGVKVTVNKELSSHFKASHTVVMSALGLPGYQFSSTYVGSSDLSRLHGRGGGPLSLQCYPVLLGEMDSSGSLNAQCSHRLSEHIRTKAVFQTQQDRFVNWQLDTEYRGDDFTATLTLGHPNLPNTSGVAVAHFLQSVWGGAGAGRGARAAPARRHPRGHPHGRGALHRRELGGDAERGPGRCARQLLPQGQPPGAGGGGVRGEHADAREQLRVRLPTHAAAHQHRLQSVCRQQLGGWRGAGEAAEAATAHAGARSLPEPPPQPLPVRIQPHRRV
ncbi:unnamed protein product, partial [Lampetra planeri]